jgi:hypothetical protein
MEISGGLVVFLSQDSDTAKTSGLVECAKAVGKTKWGSRLLTCMKPRLLRLHKSTNKSSWVIGVMLGATGPGITSTSPEEQRRSRIRVGLKAISILHQPLCVALAVCFGSLSPRKQLVTHYAVKN